MDIPYTPPRIRVSSFNCPHCKAFSSVSWSDTYYNYARIKIENLKVAHCNHCGKYSLWQGEAMIFPHEILVEYPNPDLPEEIQRDYFEAAEIVEASPRGAAAILRVAIEKLVDHVKAEGTDLNVKIGYLVKKKNLNRKIQKALDIVRVVGNSAVHAGQIDMTDDYSTALKLFVLVNRIAQQMITEPQEVDSIYLDLVPEKNKADIVRRDRK